MYHRDIQWASRRKECALEIASGSIGEGCTIEITSGPEEGKSVP